jgi:HlyD family secretion protein
MSARDEVRPLMRRREIHVLLWDAMRRSHAALIPVVTGGRRAMFGDGVTVPGDPRDTIRRCNVAGLSLLALLVVGFGGWSMATSLAGAVIAPGSIVVESSVKKVQHPTGGVVRDILVKEGDMVEAGQELMRLDETLTKSSLGIVVSQREELVARRARLAAELQGAETVDFPPDLTARRSEPLVNNALDGELRLFNSRKLANEGQRAQLSERITQIEQEINGLSAQLAGKETEIKFISEELAGVTDLYQKKLVTVVRYNQLHREDARLTGEHGNIVAEIARARGRINEARLQIIQIDQNFRTEAIKEQREVDGKLSEVMERVVAAGDQYDRTTLRAPQSGVVQQMAVHTVGGVVAAGETVMLIVPRNDVLVFDGRVEPQDIDQVEVGAKVHIRIHAGNQRMNPDLDGVLERKAPDLTREEKNDRPYYLVRATMAKSEVGKLGDLKLVPGMQAEAFIRTHESTPMHYLLKPMMDQVSRAFRER